MKLYVYVLFGFFIISCQSSTEEARKPEPKPEVQKPFKPISDEVIAHAVLYEANIRQYSPEGTFNAFAKDLAVLKKMGIKL